MAEVEDMFVIFAARRFVSFFVRNHPNSLSGFSCFLLLIFLHPYLLSLEIFYLIEIIIFFTSSS